MVDEDGDGQPPKKRKRPSSGSGGERPSQKGRKLKQYVLEEKLDIIDYAKVIGNRAAGREFNVAESSIREWRKNELRLRSMFESAPERSRLDGGGRRPVSEDLEKSLLIYVASTAAAESPLTWHAIKEKANDIWNEICEKNDDIKEKDFSANMGWVARFVKRNNLQVPAPCSASLNGSGAETPNGICHHQPAVAATTTTTITTTTTSALTTVPHPPVAVESCAGFTTEVIAPSEAPASVVADGHRSPSSKMLRLSDGESEGGATSERQTPASAPLQVVSTSLRPSTVSPVAVGVGGGVADVVAEVTSRRRRRKNFTPKKVLVKHCDSATIVANNNILLEAIAADSECEMKQREVEKDGNTKVTVAVTPGEEEENIDVCC